MSFHKDCCNKRCQIFVHISNFFLQEKALENFLIILFTSAIFETCNFNFAGEYIADGLAR